MKKITLFLILFLSVLLFIPNTAYAVTTPEENLFDEFKEWTLSYEFGRYFLRSNVVKIEHDNVEIFLNDTQTIFTYPNGPFEVGSKSKVAVWQDYDWTILQDEVMFKWENGSQDTTLIASDDGTTLFDFGIYKAMYMQIYLQLDPSLTPSQRGQLAFQINQEFRSEVFDVSVLATNDIGVGSLLTELPTTSGSPFNQDELIHVNEQDYGTVEFAYANGDITFWITYYGFYSYTIESVVLSDDSFLDNVQNAYYYTEDGEHFIYFTYGENDDFVLTDGNALSKVWTGFTIWNLDTGEVFTTQRVWALTYIDVEDDLNAYAYFTMPNIEEDDLLSVSITYDYRLGKKGLTTLWTQQYTDWSTNCIVLEKDSQSLSAYPSWAVDTMTGSAAAVVVGMVLSAFQITAPIGIPLIYAGSVGLVVGGAGAVINMIVGNIDDITPITYPPQTLINTLNDHYSILSGKSINVTGQKVYKLFIGGFEDVSVNYVEFNQDNFKYTEIVFTTEGTVYSAYPDNIDSEVIVDVDYVANAPEETVLPNVWNAMMIPLITVMFIVLIFKTKALSNIKQFGIVVILYGVVLYFVLNAL